MWWYSKLHRHPFNLKNRQIKCDNHSSKLFDTTQHQQFRGIVDAMLITRQIGYNKANNTVTASNGCKGPIYF